MPAPRQPTQMQEAYDMKYSHGISTWMFDLTQSQVHGCWNVSWYYCRHILSEQNITCDLVVWVHWLRAKATKDRWTEEEGFLHTEFQWTISFFKHCMWGWRDIVVQSQSNDLTGPACYAARQQATYAWLSEEGRAEWESILHSTGGSLDASPKGNPFQV